jgi:hypothetical protein
MECSGLPPEGQHQTNNDGHIGQVEYRPPSQINEIDNVAPAEYVQEVSCRAANRQAKAEKGDITLEPGAGTVQNDCGDERYKPDEHQRNSGAAAPVDSPQIRYKSNPKNWPARDTAPLRMQLHSPLAPLVKEQEHTARSKHVEHANSGCNYLRGKGRIYQPHLQDAERQVKEIKLGQLAAIAIAHNMSFLTPDGCGLADFGGG